MTNDVKFTHTNVNGLISVTIISPLRISFDEIAKDFTNYVKEIGATVSELAQVDLLFISQKEDIIFGTALCRQSRATISTVKEIFSIKRESNNILRLMELCRNIISDVS